MFSTRDDLQRALDGGLAVEYCFFWGHTPRAEGVADRSCLSQWFLREFSVQGVTYRSAEHFMMAEKARCFGDEVTRRRIIEVETPREAKALGRQVTPFDEAVWAAKRFDLVVAGNVAKFSQHEDLRRVLLDTKNTVLVEAAPRDCVWGIGLSAQKPKARHPSTWRGHNLLGFALMHARERVRSLSAGDQL